MHTYTYRREREEGRERERSCFHSLVHFLMVLNSQAWVRAKLGVQDSILGLPCGWEGCWHLIRHLLPPRMFINRKLA